MFDCMEKSWTLLNQNNVFIWSAETKFYDYEYDHVGMLKKTTTTKIQKNTDTHKQKIKINLIKLHL